MDNKNISPVQKQNTDITQAPLTEPKSKDGLVINSEAKDAQGASTAVVGGYEVATVSSSTDQEERNPDGTFKKGIVPKTGFHTNPERRNPGGWVKSSTARFKMEKMIELSDEELQSVIDDELAPTFEKRLAKALISASWREIKELTEQVYGRAKETVDVTTQGEKITGEPYKALSLDELRKLADK